MKLFNRMFVFAGTALLAACGAGQDSISNETVLDSPSVTEEVQAASHLCDPAVIVGSLEPGASCFHGATAFTEAESACAGAGAGRTLTYSSWNISQGVTCPPGHVTWVRYVCCIPH